MPGRKQDEHRDRGDGVCVTCFEELPCAVLTGDSLVPRLWEEDREHERAEYKKIQDAREQLADLINERLIQLGIKDGGRWRPLQVVRYSTTVTMQTETLAKLLSLIPADTPPMSEEDDDEELDL